MKKIKEALATFKLTFDFTESVNEMIEDDTLHNKKDIKEYLLESMVDILYQDLIHYLDTNITFKISP